MVITLNDTKVNTTAAVDLAVIDEFRKSSFLLNAMPFLPLVSPVGGGATMVYEYTRLIQEVKAHGRKQNQEYPKGQAKRKRFTTNPIPLGNAYEIDRVLAHQGPAATDEVNFQQTQAIKSTIAKFHDMFINGVAEPFDGDTAGKEAAFDGLDAAVTGTVTEATFDGSNITDKASALKAKAALNKWLRSFDGAPTAIFGNEDGIAWLEQIADMIGFYTDTKDEFGNTVQTFRGTPFVDLKEKDGSNDPIISTSGDGLTSLYAARLAEDGTVGISTLGGTIIKTWLPDFSIAGAVKTGEVEFGPVGLAVKKTRSAGAFRVKVGA